MDNMVTIVCDGCDSNLELEGSYNDWAGQEVECPNCGVKLQIAAPEAVVAPANKCPGCGKEMGERAVFCVACGYDTRTGKKITGL